ncbi:MAG: thioesterase [Desulfuromonas sp.]|nr:MAG: thioesterase [Desulfuromonas sp.]
MKKGVQVGLEKTISFRVTEAKTVPSLYPESEEFRSMPPVFATGFMVGFMEWACIEALKPFMDEGEGSVGTMINVTHEAATPVGMVVEATARCTAIEGKKISWEVIARDEVDIIGRGTHERFVIDYAKFNARLAAKAGAK